MNDESRAGRLMDSEAESEFKESMMRSFPIICISARFEIIYSTTMCKRTLSGIHFETICNLLRPAIQSSAPCRYEIIYVSGFLQSLERDEYRLDFGDLFEYYYSSVNLSVGQSINPKPNPYICALRVFGEQWLRRLLEIVENQREW